MNATVSEIDVLASHCRDIIEKGSKSFAGASRLLGPDTRTSVYLLYAWCRHCDDVIDAQELGFSRNGEAPASSDMIRALGELRDKTRAAIAGRAEEPVFRALQHVIAKHRIPDRHPLELLAGFEMDAVGRTYETLEDTLSYAYHVAGVVGVMMAMIMGVRDRSTLERAQDLGIAFQLTNIARDVIDDARIGRVYLPHDWLEKAGVAPTDLADESKRAEVFQVVNRLLDVADAYYESAAYGIAKLPMRSAWAIASARNVYRDIGTIVRIGGASAWDQRPVVSKRRKLKGVVEGLGLALLSRLPEATRASPPRDPGLWTMDGLGDG
jgi:phytoene synthase